jgi:tungstate transport system substrate-binding protein
VKKMKTTAIAAIILIVIIISGIGAYAAYAYTQNQSPQPTPTPTPTPSPTPTPTVTPSSSPTAKPSATASPIPTTNPTASPSPSPSPTPAPSPTTLRVATTTSLYDTGLEDTPETLKNGTVVKDDLKDAFQTKYPWITVNFIPLGTGAAIAQAQRGDADMLLVHSPSQELTYLKGGYGVDRKIIAYNYFVIVGPASDPAHISGLTNVSQVLKNIYDFGHNSSNVLWFSRNDASGTNTKEISLWTAAGYTYAQLTNTTLNGSWFKSTGTGMGQTLLATNYYGSIGGYTIADTGTFLSYSTRGDIQLKTLVQGQQSLLNVYSAIIDDPRNAALTNTNFAASLLFVNYLVSNEGQQLIGNYGVTIYNQSLFTPFVPLASGAISNDTVLGWIKSYAYMSNDAVPVISASGTECPTQYRYNAGDLFSATYDLVANFNANISISTPNYYVADKRRITLAQAMPTPSSSKVYRT